MASRLRGPACAAICSLYLWGLHAASLRALTLGGLGGWPPRRRSVLPQRARGSGRPAVILVGGENLIDFIETSGEAGDRRPCFRANPGGSPYNAAKALGRQLEGADGIEVGYLTPISRDALGDLLAEGLSSAGVSLLAARCSAPTSLAVVSLRGGIPSYEFYRENTAERKVTAEMLFAATPSNAVALFLGSLALTGGVDADVWAEYFCVQKRAGLFTMLDPNIRAAFITDRASFMARLRGVLRHTDLLKLSDEDLEWLLPGRPDPQGAAGELLRMSGAALVVVTLGAGGAFALTRSGDSEVTVQASAVRSLQDTVGAGDTFGATLLRSLAVAGRLDRESLAGLSPTEVEALLESAACAAALNCEREGCDPPRRAEVEAALAGSK
mmetsp:Transcript_91026/g.284743  ORF Transcript_91026/g.284743 Transcript_91026/m.284743 type:complete len:384 (-) Transcript_91026:52-1203(-)